MSDETSSPEEQEYTQLFTSVEAPATMRRWDRVDAAAAGSRAWLAWAGLSRFDLRGRYLPIAVAAVISVVVGSTGAAIGLHGRLGGGTTAGTPGTPPARSFATMAYDPADHITLLFGGQGNDGKDLADTWAWDGSSWRQLHPSVSPSARMGAQMAWDADRGRMVLFGGQGQSAAPVPQLGIACVGERPCPPIRVGGPLTDTWTWDGNTWRQEHPAHHPGYGVPQGMVDDPGTHKVILVSLAPAALQPGDGSAPPQLKSPSMQCSGGQCSTSCSSWSSSGTGGDASGGGCSSSGSVPPALTCPPVVSPEGRSGKCTSFTVTASGTVTAGTVTATATADRSGAGTSSVSATSGASPAPPCFTLNTGVADCGGTAETAAFGWNGSDWTVIDSMQSGASGHFATDPRSERPLALTETTQVTCTPSAAAGATSAENAKRFPVPCLECLPNVACAVAGSGASTPAGSPSAKPPYVLPEACPAVTCSSFTITVSLKQWRFDGAWHASDVSGPLSQAVNTGKAQISAIATDTADGTVVAIIDGNNSAQTWRFDGSQWVLVPGATTPFLVGASIAADPHGLVLFGGQSKGLQQRSDATYTWDGHRWTLHGAAANTSTPTPTPTAAVSTPGQSSPTPRPTQTPPSEPSTTTTTGQATPTPTPTRTPG